MNILKPEKTFKFIVFFIATFCFYANSQAITLSELRQISTDNDIENSTAHMVYTKKTNLYNYNKEASDKLYATNKDKNLYKIRKINMHTDIKVDAIVDSNKSRIKASITDLRNIDELLKQNDLPSIYKGCVNQNGSTVLDNGYGMLFKELKEEESSRLTLIKDPGMRNNYLNAISFGKINKKLLSNDLNPVLTEIQEEGKTLLQIQLSDDSGKKNLFITCDPDIAYRIKKMKTYINNTLINETIADNYKEVNGTPYPFSYTIRKFNTNGEPISEVNYIFEKVQFENDFSEEDFKLFIFKGTKISDFYLSQERYSAKETGYISIKDILSRQSKRIADEELANLINLKNESHVLYPKEIFIPHIEKALEETSPFVFDFSEGEFVSVPMKITNLDNEVLYDFLVKNNSGDIAWNGKLVTLRGTDILKIKKEINRPFKYRSKKWSGVCELPDQLKLPYSMILKNKEGDHFLINIKEINSNGITITYVMLQDQDLKKNLCVTNL